MREPPAGRLVRVVLASALLPMAGWSAAQGAWIAALIIGLGGLAQVFGLAADTEGGA